MNSKICGNMPIIPFTYLEYVFLYAYKYNLCCLLLHIGGDFYT
jgi:hypothetical protein